MFVKPGTCTLLLLVLLFLTSACAPTRRVSETPARPAPKTSVRTTPPPGRERGTPVRPPADRGTQVEALLRSEVADWEGTPHVYGGTSRRGLDCSAFTQIIFDDLFAVALPRTTEQQVRVGEEVRPAELKPGDLVFFTPSRKSRHVGIYLSDGEFAHVSSSRGVMISHLDERYWQNAYWTSRRVLAEEQSPAGPEPDRAAEAGPWIDPPRALETTSRPREREADQPRPSRAGAAGGRRAGW